jgi:hypothetical protein
MKVACAGQSACSSIDRDSSQAGPRVRMTTKGRTILEILLFVPVWTPG